MVSFRVLCQFRFINAIVPSRTTTHKQPYRCVRAHICTDQLCDFSLDRKNEQSLVTKTFLKVYCICSGYWVRSSISPVTLVQISIGKIVV